MSSWYDNNIYYAPEKYGFFSVDSVELDNEAYQYNILASFKNELGYYLATDSGCSCPTPFENLTMDDLTGPLTAEQAREEANSLIGTAAGYKWSEGPDPLEVEDFLAAIV